MDKRFRKYSWDEPLPMSPDLREWLPEDHLVHFICDVVEVLDLSPIYADYSRRSRRGQPPYHPKMMVRLILYAYCTGKPSSRKIEKATYEDVAFRMLAGNEHPDHDTIASFRKVHLVHLAAFFVQVLQLAQRAGLVKLGHVALDGTKVKANASKHKAMSYDRMVQAETKLLEEVQALLDEAQQVDEEENARYGQGCRGNELPDELARRQSRLATIQKAKAALEQAAREKAEVQAEEQRAKIQERERKEKEAGKPLPGRRPNAPNDPAQAVPEPKAQRNFTDPDSRIMKDGATKSFEQAYNAQAVVDSHAQIVVAASVTQDANDKKQLVPMLQKAEAHLGEMPKAASADTGYFSEEAVTAEALEGVDLHIAVGRQKHDERPIETTGEPPEGASVAEAMQHKLRTPEGRALYKMRKAIVEPVFGQIKDARGFRRFSFRGLEGVNLEWDLICLTHNLLKLFRAGVRWQTV